MTARHGADKRGAGYHLVLLPGIFLALPGLLLGVGGAWLARLGGSLYYAAAGIGLIVSGYLLARHSLGGVRAYVLTWLFTGAWALWEVGLDGWPLVPRLVAPTVLFIVVLLCIPVLSGRRTPGRVEIVATASAAVAIVLAGMLAPRALPGGTEAQAQAAPDPRLRHPSPLAAGETLPRKASPGSGDDEAAGEAKARQARRQPADMRQAGADWPAYGGSDFATRYSPLATITRDNVGRLVNAGWRLGFTGLMCKEPPCGGIRAIELAIGRTLWDRPFGTARANGPFGIPSRLPFLIGTPNNGGPIITAGGLIAAATDNLIRAIDVETGETLWSDVLPAGGQATPITYEAGGRQYVAIFAGGHHFMETPIGDYLIAYALPE